MASWIYIFSKFTPEALLFEALLICALVSSYAAFWVLRKRRFGAIENEVPASVVKVYLNELIGEAEDMKTQLFGLLSGGSPRPRHAEGAGPSFVISGDAAEKLSALERKMAEQASAMEHILSEKAKIEKELSAARASGATTGAPAADGSEDVAKLQEKCQSLEARLAEYSVIEDDLANLKRLQQENASLKSQLANNGSGTTASAPPPTSTPTPAPTPTAVAPTPEPVPAAAASEAPALEAAPVPTPEPLPQAAAPAEAQAEVPAAAAPAATFEGLVDEVEKSLQSSTPAATAAETPTPQTGAKGPEKTDEDLIAEFEKMLNS